MAGKWIRYFSQPKAAAFRGRGDDRAGARLPSGSSQSAPRLRSPSSRCVPLRECTMSLGVNEVKHSLNPRKKGEETPKGPNAGPGARKQQKEGVAPKQPEKGAQEAEMPAFRKDHRVALEARAQRCELCGEGGALCSPHGVAPQAPATAPDPGRPAPGPRPGGAPPGWAGIDRRTDKSIDFCAEKLIDLLLAPRTREPPAGGAGDPSVLGGRAPGKPRDPQRLPPRGPRRLQEPASLSPGRGVGAVRTSRRVPEEGLSRRESRRERAKLAPREEEARGCPSAKPPAPRRGQTD